MLTYKTETESIYLYSKSNRIDENPDKSDQTDIFTFFKDLKQYVQKNDSENVLDILMDLSNLCYDIDHIPSNFTKFFIDCDILSTITTLIQNPLISEILTRVLKILNQLVLLSIYDSFDFHNYLFENKILELLFEIRESIPFDYISTYTHLIANFCYCNAEARNQVMNQYPPTLLESLIIEQGEKLIDIRHETSFLIWRISSYPVLKDGSLSDFIGWLVYFFSKFHLNLDLISLRYILFAFDNFIFKHKEIKPMMLISFSYFEIIEYYIKSRNDLFIQESEEKSIIIENEHRADIDEILEIILKIVDLFIESSFKFISTDIILDLFEIFKENWKICSELSMKIMTQIIKRSGKIFLFDQLENIQILFDIYDLAPYKIKYNVIILLNEIIFIAPIDYVCQIGPITIPKLIEYLNDTNDINLIKYTIDLLSSFVWYGSIQNGLRKNKFYDIIAENDGFDFLCNFEEKLESLDLDEHAFSNVNSLVEEILEQIPPPFNEDDESFPMDENTDSYQSEEEESF